MAGVAAAAATQRADGRPRASRGRAADDRSAWRVLRPREDKSLPNAQHVAEKVMRSIRDGIGQDELLEMIRLRAYGARPPGPNPAGP